MSKQRNHGITWTEHTWNPVRGCTRVSEGCRNCYAETMAARFSGPGQPYEGLARMTPSGPRWTGNVQLVEGHLLDPLRWTRPRLIFVNSMSDLFHEALSDEAIDRIFAVMALAPRHTFQVLTKRPERMLAYLTGVNPEGVAARIAEATKAITPSLAKGTPPSCVTLHAVGPMVDGTPEFGWRRFIQPWPLPNVWLGVSVEDQATADERIPLLLQTPAAVRWVSAEPLLGPVDLRHLHYEGMVEIDALTGDHGVYRPLSGRSDAKLHWLVVGGESGPGARPMHPDWARSLRDQCQAAVVAYFFKQWGEWAPVTQIPDDTAIVRESIGPERLRWLREDSTKARVGDMSNRDGDVLIASVGKRAAGDLLDGRQWREYPR